MKDVPIEIIESNRPAIPLLEAVNFCLERLYEDRGHGFTDSIAKDLTYEEVIGALLLARDDATCDGIDESGDP